MPTRTPHPRRHLHLHPRQPPAGYFAALLKVADELPDGLVLAPEAPRPQDLLGLNSSAAAATAATATAAAAVAAAAAAGRMADGCAWEGEGSVEAGEHVLLGAGVLCGPSSGGEGDCNAGEGRTMAWAQQGPAGHGCGSSSSSRSVGSRGGSGRSLSPESGHVPALPGYVEDERHTRGRLERTSSPDLYVSIAPKRYHGGTQQAAGLAMHQAAGLGMGDVRAAGAVSRGPAAVPAVA